MGGAAGRPVVDAGAGSGGTGGVRPDAAVAVSPDAAVPPDVRPPDPTPAMIQAACAAWAPSHCRRFGRCAPLALSLVLASEANCIEKLAAECVRFRSLPGAPLPSKACLDSYESVSCSEFLDNNELTRACQEPGGLPDGASCADGSQCRSRGCRFEPNAPCGRCGPPGAVGDPCRKDYDCDRGLDCGPMKRCLRPGVEGAPCDPDRPCLDRLFCAGGRCAPRLPLGATCEGSNDGCDYFAGVACNATLYRCVGVSVAPYCRANLDGSLVLCAGNGTCQADGACTPAVPEGGACGGDRAPWCAWPAACEAGRCSVQTLPQMCLRP
jgi:hypothetical protein